MRILGELLATQSARVIGRMTFFTSSKEKGASTFALRKEIEARRGQNLLKSYPRTAANGLF
jgi:hypothetical protein